MTKVAPVSSTIRRGKAADAVICADILNNWIDAQDWMPRLHSKEDVRGFYCDFVFSDREVWVIGTPVTGFMALDTASEMVTALYVATPGKGAGRALLDHAKIGRDGLTLWTFVANAAARRFYQREGFKELRRTDGDNEEGLPDILMQWERG